jgi:ElaA protein
MENKAFEALSVDELYNLLKLRSEIFVVEQNCVYLDLDGKDKLALHLLQSLKESSSMPDLLNLESVLIMHQ